MCRKLSVTSNPPCIIMPSVGRSLVCRASVRHVSMRAKNGQSVNSTEFIGVKARGLRFRAYATIDGRMVTIGTYDTAEQAARARDAELVRLGLTKNRKMNFDQDGTRIIKAKISSEFVDVTWDKRRAKWQAQIALYLGQGMQKMIYIGCFDGPDGEVPAPANPGCSVPTLPAS